MDPAIEPMPDRIGELHARLDQEIAARRKLEEHVHSRLQALYNVNNALTMRVLALEQELRASAHDGRGARRST